jgi:hypothetical protein
MRLTHNFTLDEFLVSATAARMGRTIEDPPDEVVASLKLLCVEVLQPLREEVKKPLVIISGYRPRWLNTAVGGSRNSSHIKGEAADFYVPGMKLMRVAQLIADMELLGKLDFDQLIYEFDSWIHISYRASGNRGQILRARKVAGRTRYTVGLE